jgi:hypothetical protein
MRVIFLAMLCAASVAFAADQGGNDAKKQEHFAKMKQVKLEGMQGRISVMQSAVSCVQSAQNPDGMRSCEERERAAMEQHQQQMKARWESLKQH